MYRNFEELLDLARKEGAPLWRIILENEIQISGKSEEQIFARLEKTFGVMERSASRALETPLSSVGGLITGVSSHQNAYAQSGRTFCGAALNRLMALALSCSEVNASMGKICAAPTAGACGIVPAVLIVVRDQLGLTRGETLKGLITASGVGAIIMANATVSGAEGGCQAECGTAAAMAAASAVELAGGPPETAADACCFALMNAMGLVCDPVAGLVQVPCAQRNASQAVNALLSADLALGGMRSIIPPDEVIGAMYSTGRMLPVQLRETAQGGLAATPTAKRLFQKIFRENPLKDSAES